MTHSSTRLPFADGAADHPEAQWKATWIWCAEPTDGQHNYVYFRRELVLDAAPQRAWLRLAAQRDATLWINGELIAHGPPISDPRFQRYETYDVTARLKPGVNCVAVRVYHDQSRGGFTAHADARGLLCQLEVDGQILVPTDDTWRAQLCGAYLRPGVPMGDSMWPEIFNACWDTPGWQRPGYDDSAWRRARTLIAASHCLWGAAQPRARFFPWVNLIPCETRPLRLTRQHPQAIVTQGEVLQQREATSNDVAIRMSLEPIRPFSKAQILEADALLTRRGPAIIRNSSPTETYETFDGFRNATLVLDFGRLMNARFGFTLTTRGGIVDVGYAYRLDEGRVIPYISMRGACADQYQARDGKQQWQTADWRHFRYVQLTFRDLPGDLVLEDVWAEELENHFDARGSFTSSDPRLDRLFEITCRTTKLNVVDRTMDNPSRERKQYLGDCSGIVPSISACFGDGALLRRYFANARESQHITGQYRYSYPGHDQDYASLFDHALSVPLRLWEHHQQFADGDLVRDLWPGIVSLLELTTSCLDAQDMMTLPPYNIWFDWGHMDRRGHFLPLQAMTAEVMRRAADLARVVGDDATRWAQIAQRMIANIPRWFDPQRGVFVDAIVDGQQQQHFSEHGNSLVAMWNLAPAEMIRAAMDHWDRNAAAFGQTSPAWMYLPAAFIRAGRPELAIRWMHQRLNQIERQGLNTWPETWCLYGERTLGTWRCRNSRAVAQGAGLGATSALLQELCGIQPAEPGFAVVRIMPQPGPLTLLHGVLPGPDGDYSIHLQQHDDHWRLALSLPSARPVQFIAALAPTAREIQVDSHKLRAQGSTSQLNGEPAGQFAFQAEKNTTLIIPRL